MAGGSQPYPPRRDPRQVRRRRPQPRPPSTRALTVKLALLAVTATLVIGGLLAVQMANGADPALGPKARAKAASQAQSPSTDSTGVDPYGGYSSDSSGYGDDSGGYSYDDGSSSGYSNAQPVAPSPPPVTTSVS